MYLLQSITIASLGLIYLILILKGIHEIVVILMVIILTTISLYQIHLNVRLFILNDKSLTEYSILVVMTKKMMEVLKKKQEESINILRRKRK